MAVHRVDNYAIRDGEHGLAIDCVTLGLLAGAGIDAALTVEPLPVDGHALADPDASVDGERGAGVAGGVTARVGGDVTGALQGRADDDDRLAINGGGASGFGDLLMAGRGGAGARDNAMGEALRDGRSGSERDVEKKRGLRALCERSRGFALAGRLSRVAMVTVSRFCRTTPSPRISTFSTATSPLEKLVRVSSYTRCVRPSEPLNGTGALGTLSRRGVISSGVLSEISDA